jgi:hypothetical protein
MLLEQGRAQIAASRTGYVRMLRLVQVLEMTGPGQDNDLSTSKRRPIPERGAHDVAIERKAIDAEMRKPLEPVRL